MKINNDLDINQFKYDLENGDTTIVTVLDNNGNFKADKDLLFDDFLNIQIKASNFDYQGYVKPDDKYWND